MTVIRIGEAIENQSPEGRRLLDAVRQGQIVTDTDLALGRLRQPLMAVRGQHCHEGACRVCSVCDGRSETYSPIAAYSLPIDHSDSCEWVRCVQIVKELKEEK